MLACDALITVDTAMAWISSGYSFPTLGLYGYEYYPMAQTSKNWQPVNPNAVYVESGKVSDIIVERIEIGLRKLLKI
jgi:ADP-heptose:LPS heptosyltransferase